MIYLAIVLALALGYVIGLLQNGININTKEPEQPKEYHKSIPDKDVKDWINKTGKDDTNFNF